MPRQVEQSTRSIALGLSLRVLSWNLYHGRAVPPAGRSLLADFAATLARWEWDVALLQEVPPWWPPELAGVAGAQERTALTSRNALLPVRRAIAQRWPDAIKSNGGGANAILIRGHDVVEHRRYRLRLWPERRVLHGVRLGDGTWVANLHATVHSPPRAAADIDLAARTVRGWAGSAPAIMGGDLNVREPSAPGFALVASSKVDHVFARGLSPSGEAEILARGALSDHAPVAVTLHSTPSGR